MTKVTSKKYAPYYALLCDSPSGSGHLRTSFGSNLDEMIERAKRYGGVVAIESLGVGIVWKKEGHPKGGNGMKNTESAWYLVANTPGVDIRHKLNGQELILVENLNYPIANKIIHAVNSHEALAQAAGLAFSTLSFRAHQTNRKWTQGDQNAFEALKNVLTEDAQAEGK